MFFFIIIPISDVESKQSKKITWVTKTFFSLVSAHQPMGKFCHMATSRSSKNYRENQYWLSNIELVVTHTVSKLGMLGIAGKLSVPSVNLCKKVQKKIKIYCSGAAQTQSTIIWLTEILRVKPLFPSRVQGIEEDKIRQS